MNEQMKVIGLIGGMSWESSKLYYELINKKVRETLGGSHSGRSIMVSVDFAEIEKLSFENRWDEIGEIMADCTKRLERAGANIILLCTNTIHLVSNEIERHSTIPFLHIAEATGEEIRGRQLKKVGLLGTKFTMEKDFYTHLLEEKYQIKVITPPAPDRQIVHDIIYSELVHGKFTELSRKKCNQIIKNLEQAGAEGVILGCTELPLLVRSSEIGIPVFDTAKIHAHKAVEWAVEHATKEYSPAN